MNHVDLRITQKLGGGSRGYFMKYDETQREQRRDETEVGVYRVLELLGEILCERKNLSYVPIVITCLYNVYRYILFRQKRRV